MHVFLNASRLAWSLGLSMAAACCLTWTALSGAAETEPQFFRGLNLNGPALTIDGNAWEGADSPHYDCSDSAFENQQISLVPETDLPRARMIRSSRWGGTDVRIKDIPSGRYSVYLYVWEDNNAETYAVSLNGRDVVAKHVSGAAGHWDKLGPWHVNVSDGVIRLTSRGGHANFSGVELWRGTIAPPPTPAASAEQIAFFEQRIRPVLAGHCYECHSAKSKEAEGGLLLDTHGGWRAGGRSGPTVVPGNVEASLLIQAVRYKDEALQMPPEGKLPDNVLADLEHWIQEGAADPRDGGDVVLAKQTTLLKEAASRWAFQAPADPASPEVARKDWPYNEVDRFILAKLEGQMLAPLENADKRSLIRRATFDLIGLPPTPDEVDAFVADASPEAFAKVVDRLLASPRYGERWGRHWLDVARFADTAGDNSDFPIPSMYRYRDWVIEAFNSDLPYDQFVRQQIAGDLLPAANDAQRNSQTIATGYLAGARRFGSGAENYPEHLTIEDTIDNLGRAFLGLTVNCARCHDHKFDPISTEDYYAIYGFLHSTRYPWPGIELEQKQRDLVSLASSEDTRRATEAYESKGESFKAELAKLEKERDGAQGDEKNRLAKAADGAREALKRHDKTLPDIAWAYAVAESSRIEDVHLQYKGNPANLGPVVPRRIPLAFGGQQLASDDATSGRKQLADWLASPSNPLTARVMVNRLWSYHFGQGIVPTPNDFGKQGKPASHAELLDWLSHRFVDSGWSIKAMHRLIMLSHTYRLAAVADPALIPGDPSNDLLSGFRRRRLDAEALRDQLLFVAGNLDLQPAGGHPFPPSAEWQFTQHNPFKAVYDSNRRSVYLMTQRIQRHPYLAIFDGPDASASTPRRYVSTTPLQALFLMNDSFTHRQAQLIAERICRERTDNADRIDWAYRLCLSRPATEVETKAGLDYLDRVQKLLAESGTAADQLDALAWQSYARSLLLLNEFVYID